MLAIHKNYSPPHDSVFSSNQNVASHEGRRSSGQNQRGTEAAQAVPGAAVHAGYPLHVGGVRVAGRQSRVRAVPQVPHKHGHDPPAGSRHGAERGCSHPQLHAVCKCVLWGGRGERGRTEEDEDEGGRGRTEDKNAGTRGLVLWGLRCCCFAWRGAGGGDEDEQKRTRTRGEEDEQKIRTPEPEAWFCGFLGVVVLRGGGREGGNEDEQKRTRTRREEDEQKIRTPEPEAWFCGVLCVVVLRGGGAGGGGRGRTEEDEDEEGRGRTEDKNAGFLGSEQNGVCGVLCVVVLCGVFYDGGWGGARKKTSSGDCVVCGCVSVCGV